MQRLDVIQTKCQRARVDRTGIRRHVQSRVYIEQECLASLCIGAERTAQFFDGAERDGADELVHERREGGV